MRITPIRLLSWLCVIAAGCSSGDGGNQPDAGVPAGDLAVPAGNSDLAAPTDGPAAGSNLAGLRTRPYPDTTGKIAILVDQLPGGMTPAQQQFVVGHFVGSQKLTLDISQPLRALAPDFLVLHYHLAIWQSAPGVDFILDGKTWSNDYPAVNTHEAWFWHNAKNERVASSVDKKLLMNLANPDFAAYWTSSFIAQTMAGDYDGVFADSASPALLQGEAQSPPDPRIAGTGVKDNLIPELGNRTYIQAWEAFITALDAALAARGIPLIPNTSAFITTWDNTRYDLTAGVFVEGFADPGFALADWKASTNQLLSLAAKGKIMILQNYLGQAGDLGKRRYYLGNYLLVKGSRTYLDYFAQGPMEWYPEWGVDLGNPVKTGAKVDDLLFGGVYQREFQKGLVLVNPSSNAVTVNLPMAMKRVEPSGGGAIPTDGMAPGALATTTTVMSIMVPPGSAEILLK